MVHSPDFPGHARLLTVPEWEWTFDDKIDHHPTRRRATVYTSLDRRRGCFHTRSLGDVPLQHYLQGGLPHVPSRITWACDRWNGGGEEVAEEGPRHGNDERGQRNQSDWARDTLEELVQCENLEEVTIQLTSNNDRDRGLVH